MLTESQKRMLENKLYHLIKESFFEQEDRNYSDRDQKDQRKNTKASEDKTESVIKWLNSDQVDQAAIARELWPGTDEDAGRSLFSKKLRGHDADGKPYSFSSDEINTMYNMKDRFIQHIE